MENSRNLLVDHLYKNKIINSKNVYQAMKSVPRHLFIPKINRNIAYQDSPVPIGEGQTISAPHMNAMMCEYLKINKGMKILEIGTGSGYHAALLAELVGKKGKIYTIERHKKLVERAKNIFLSLNYSNIITIHQDGTIGLKEFAPFDRILVTAAGPKIPNSLKNQLSKNNGILCIPVGKKNMGQNLVCIYRNNDIFNEEIKCKVVFVPLIGKDGFKE